MLLLKQQTLAKNPAILSYKVCIICKGRMQVSTASMLFQTPYDPPVALFHQVQVPVFLVQEI